MLYTVQKQRKRAQWNAKTRSLYTKEHPEYSAIYIKIFWGKKW